MNFRETHSYFFLRRPATGKTYREKLRGQLALFVRNHQDNIFLETQRKGAKKLVAIVWTDPANPWKGTITADWTVSMVLVKGLTDRLGKMIELASAQAWRLQRVRARRHRPPLNGYPVIPAGVRNDEGGIF